MKNALLDEVVETMSRINGINLNLYSSNMNLYTKRTCSDNSEIYIASKLNMLCARALSSKNMHFGKRNLRKMLEGNNLDETV